ncbi:negative elongation factor E-like [Oscarella lobularis]|uniref:negative elongation factor E-like n=1 Tax=Oscarella lobularis TaxID=121494 RepID=UPI003313995B
MIKSLPLTPQEESLKQKYAILREKREAARAAAAAAAAASSEKISRPPAKRVARVDHQARSKKVASENQSSDKIGFKRSKNLEKRLKEQAKEQKGPRYESWTSSSAATGIDAETPSEERDDGDQQLPKKPASGKGTGKAMKGLYESFVPASGRPGTVPAIRGKKLFVECWGVKEGDLREAFESIGPLADFDPAPNRGYSFVTYNSIETADLAIKQLNNKQISNCSVKVSFARNQPGSIDISRIEVVEGHVRSKSSAASTESPLKDSRKPVVYDNDPF